jgi:hypothetical protein
LTNKTNVKLKPSLIDEPNKQLAVKAAVLLSEGGPLPNGQTFTVSINSIPGYLSSKRYLILVVTHQSHVSGEVTFFIFDINYGSRNLTHVFLG